MPLLKFDNLMGSPLGMAGLGLLMQPTQSYQPINPMTGIAQGMVAANQYRQNKSAAALDAQRIQAEQERQAYEYEKYLDEQAKYKREMAEEERKRGAYQGWLAGQSPEMQAIYSVNPELAYTKSLEAQFSQPKLNATQENYERAKAEGFEGTFMDYQVAMANAKRPSMSVTNVMGGDKPLTPAELSNLRSPNGEPLPYGTTSTEAAGLGAVPVPPQTPAEKTAEALSLDKQKLAQKKAEQESIASRNLMLLEQEIAANGGLQSIVPGSPAAQKIEGLRTAAAIAMARSQSPDPNQEPNDPIVQQFREMLPGHVMGAFGVTSGIDAARSLLGNPVSETGEIVPTQSEAEWVTLPNGVRVREKR